MEEKQRIAGSVFPRGWPGGPSELRAECPIEGFDPQVEVTVSFLQPVERQVLDATGEPVADLSVAGKRYATREETIEHEVRLSSLPNRTAELKTAGCKQAELVENGAVAGTLRWRWGPLHATVEAWVEEATPRLQCVRVSVANRLEWDGDDTAERNWLRSFHSTHVVMRRPDGAFEPGRVTRGQPSALPSYRPLR